MPERFGRYVLLEELERGWRGVEYRAAALAGPDLERLVSLLRLDAALSGREKLLEHLQAATRVAAAHTVAVHEIGRIEGTAFVASDLVEGKSLQGVLARGREEAIPMAPDNAVQVASRVAAALERAHGRSSSEGGPLVHGLVAPDSVMVAYDGEVGVRGFGWWTSGAWHGRIPERQLRYLAPEQRGGVADPRCDVYAVGAILLECLTGMHPESALADARLPDGDPLPPPLAALLAKALDADPARRLADGHELRRALDALFHSGDIAPTTFNLAYFMYTLFRNAVEHEARLLERERHAIYADPVSEAPSPGPADSPAPAPVSPSAPAPKASVAIRRTPTASAPAAHPPRVGVRWGVTLGVAALTLAALAAGSYLFLRPPPTPVPTPAPTPGPEEVAALARVRELEARLQTIEEEKAQAEAAAAEAARQQLEAEAARKGRAVDRAAVTRAEEAAARQARAEQEERQVAEKKRIADEMQAEAARLQAARVAAPPSPPADAPSPSASPAATAEGVGGPSGGASLPSLAPSASPARATASGSTPAGAAGEAPGPSGPVIYAADAPGVTPPVLLQQPRLEYPVLAMASRVQGVVVVNAVVDEKGSVSEARAVSTGNEILREAAVAHVSKRRYSPGKKEGAPVKVRIVVYVTFKFER
jgi:TonB family protein